MPQIRRGCNRAARAASLLDEVRAMLYRKIQLSDPRLDDREIRIRVAESLYRADPSTRRLLKTLRG